jgi:hypothetical protein
MYTLTCENGIQPNAPPPNLLPTVLVWSALLAISLRTMHVDGYPPRLFETIRETVVHDHPEGTLLSAFRFMNDSSRTVSKECAVP